MSAHGNGRPAPLLGVLEWFEPGEHERVERVLEGLRELGVEHLRTGLSWAEWHAPGGVAWYDWLLPRLASDVEVLPCLTYTPPSLGVEPHSSAPPRRPRDYADFVDVVLTRYGSHFDAIELWNEPNNRAEWDWTLDPEWRLFAEMVGAAAYWARQRGHRTVLGGMSPVDATWLWLMREYGVLEWIDVVGVHGFPGTLEANWKGWERHLDDVRLVLADRPHPPDVWITEVGYSTWAANPLGQLQTLLDALAAPVSRVYWYAAEDLAPERPVIDRLREDVRDYHFGLRRADGRPKLLARLLAGNGMPAVESVVQAGERRARARRAGATVVTGGAGFVGTNLAHRLLGLGERVRIVDSLERPGVEENLRWLCESHPEVEVEIADVRDRFALRRALAGATSVYHLAAQVAVTTSLDAPTEDFDVNLRGTHNLLEEVRRLPEPPPVVFTSTNKVYGGLPDLPLGLRERRWEPVDPVLRRHGLDESRPLDFCTPYGCSKGGADQYVLDYAKSYDVPAVVFRMSCIYGPHQHGTEDQGWVAHFLIRALAGEEITLYGDGCQVRDILFVDDLVDALVRARARVGSLWGSAFNIGGGARNSVSLLEVLDLVAEVTGAEPTVTYAEERMGDQRYYVADTRRFRDATGWAPETSYEEGIGRLADWLARVRGASRRAASRVVA